MWNSRRGPGVQGHVSKCEEGTACDSLGRARTQSLLVPNMAHPGMYMNESWSWMTCATSHHAMVIWYHDGSWCIMFKNVTHRFSVARAESCKLTQLQPCPLEGRAVWMHPKYLHSPGAEQQVCPVTFWHRKKQSKTVRSSSSSSPNTPTVL